MRESKEGETRAAVAPDNPPPRGRLQLPLREIQPSWSSTPKTFDSIQHLSSTRTAHSCCAEHISVRWNVFM